MEEMLLLIEKIWSHEAAKRRKEIEDIRDKMRSTLLIPCRHHSSRSTTTDAWISHLKTFLKLINK